MCVICYTNNKQISDEEIKLMWDANPQGAGFAWIENKKCHFSKGYMSLDELIEALPKDRTGLMLHFRIATSGDVDSIHCHPFDIEKPNRVQGKSNRVLFHNGVCGIDWEVSKSDMKKHSDTYLLARDILSQVKTKSMYDFVLSSGWSKYALFDSNIYDDRWILFGKWEKYNDMDVSNKNFIPVPKSYFGYGIKTNSLPKVTNYMQRFPDDEWDDWYGGGNNVEPVDKEENESSEQFQYCDFCDSILEEVDIPYGICEECSNEHGIYCPCGTRMSPQDFYSSGELCGSCLDKLESHLG